MNYDFRKTILPMLIAMIIIMMKCRSVRARPGGCVLLGGKKVDIKHLVMTGKEHRLPQAVFFPSPLHISSTCQSLSSILEKGSTNYWCDLRSCCRTEMSKPGSLTGLFSMLSIQPPFLCFKYFLVGVIRRKLLLFKAVKVRVTDLIIIKAV